MVDSKMIPETQKILHQTDSHDPHEFNLKSASEADPDPDFGSEDCRLTVRQFYEVIRVYGVHLRAAFDQPTTNPPTRTL